ncbi:substrate-binding domain-containing protein (plasmid) [Haladaptatus sp. SPP-AMP-3]|uniref:substrate-binding domain-containing protein n=1 Tax=Haladaptatus sp. SPP-AMP-3 TaxID=3121295 RepID=UPI003C2EAF59
MDRRTFVKAVSAGGVATGLAGCSGLGNSDSGSSGGNTTLRITAHTEWRNNKEKITKALHDAGLPDDINVEMISAGQTTDEMQTKYRQWLSAGRPDPDLMVFDCGWTTPFIVRGQLKKLDDVLPKKVLNTVNNDYFQQSVNSAKSNDGSLYGVPLYTDLPTIQYRKDLVENAGYDWSQYKTKAMSWKQFSEELADVHNQSDAKYGFNWQAASEIQLACCVFNEFLSSWGGAYFGNPEENLYKVGDRPITVEEKPVIDSLKMARTFIHGSDAPDTLDSITGKITSTEASQWGLSPSMRPFTQGNAVALRNWPYSININGADDALGEKMGVMPIPYGVKPGEAKYPGTGGSVAALGGWNFSMNPNTENEDACVEFFKAMSTKSFQLDNFKIAGHIPPVPKTLQNATDVPVMGRYVDTLAFAGQHTLARPATVIWPEQSQAVAQKANAVIMGDVSAEKGMSQLASQLNKLEQKV